MNKLHRFLSNYIRRIIAVPYMYELLFSIISFKVSNILFFLNIVNYGHELCHEYTNLNWSRPLHARVSIRKIILQQSFLNFGTFQNFLSLWENYPRVDFLFEQKKKSVFQSYSYHIFRRQVFPHLSYALTCTLESSEITLLSIALRDQACPFS